jgi:hypothetical protein
LRRPVSWVGRGWTGPALTRAANGLLEEAQRFFGSTQCALDWVKLTGPETGWDRAWDLMSNLPGGLER